MIRMERVRMNPAFGTAVVSGEDSEDIFPEKDAYTSSEDEYDDEDLDGLDLQMEHTSANDDERDVEIRSSYVNVDANDDDLYDENLDAEDEAYVYRHMRGGVRELVSIVLQQPQQQQQQHKNMDQKENSTKESLQEVKTKFSNNYNQPRQQRQRQLLPLYKPRHSDATLSCPCCFNIVCMDCQRHSRYHNQFRAIFVMGIAVDWHRVLVYDPVHQALISKSDFSSEPNEARPPRHALLLFDEEEEHVDDNDVLSWSWLEQPVMSTMWRPPPTTEGEYFAVECANCGTQVAALDMREEVYHFHGCLESSALT
jgi:hypothetical protein